MKKFKQFRKATKEEILSHFNMNTQEKTFSVRESFIKQAHSAACLDWKRKIEGEFPSLFTTYSIGDRFKHEDGDEYILAKIDGYHVNLICLSSGNRWGDSVKVDSISEITPSEFAQFYSSKNFTRINK